MEDTEQETETTFWVKRIVEEGVNEEGQRVIKTQWFKMNKPLDLGSVINPKNTDIIAFKWVERQKGIDNFLGGFFRGFG